MSQATQATLQTLTELSAASASAEIAAFLDDFFSQLSLSMIAEIDEITVDNFDYQADY